MHDRDTLRRRAQQYWISLAHEAQQRESHRAATMWDGEKSAIGDYFAIGWRDDFCSAQRAPHVPCAGP
jgi:hypothetical protein